MMQIKDLYIYPVKSLAGIRVERAQVQLRGLQYDRRWMVTDPEGQFLTQRQFPAMALLGTAIEPPFLVLFDRFNPSDRVAIPLHTEPDPAAALTVQVWDDRVQAFLADEDASAWLSEKLGTEAVLVGMSDTASLRPTDAKYAPEGQLVSFSDGFPMLCIGQASLDDLNTRLAQPVPMNRFRPNIVVAGSAPYAEETWEAFTAGNVALKGVKPCGRCIMTTIDQNKGQKGAEPLKTLAAYKSVGNKIIFGQNVILTGEEGAITVGDRIQL